MMDQSFQVASSFFRLQLTWRSSKAALLLPTTSLLIRRRKWQPAPVFLPGESQWRRSRVGCHLWGHTELDTTVGSDLAAAAVFWSRWWRDSGRLLEEEGKAGAWVVSQRWMRQTEELTKKPGRNACIFCPLSHVQLFATPMGCSPPGSSVHGNFQVRILEWVAISSSRRSSWPRDRTYISWVSYIGRQIPSH